MKQGTFLVLQNLIVSEKKALSCFTELSLRKIEKVIDSISKRQGKIITTGIGKSAFIAQKCAATLTSLGNFSLFVHPTDAFHGDSGVVKNGDVVVAFSYSGESVEVVKFCKYIKSHFDILLVVISGNNKSGLAKISDSIIEIKIDTEGSPMNCAPMASVTVSLVAADLIASGLIKEGFSEEHFSRLHPGGKLGMNFRRVKELMTQAPLMDEGDLFQAVEVINRYKKGIVGVLKNKKLVGVLTDGDIRRLFGQDGKQKVYDFMSRKPKIINKDSTILEALRVMENNKITSLFVLDKVLEKSSVVGIIHMHDIIQQYVA